jgi:hypothetical protein
MAKTIEDMLEGEVRYIEPKSIYLTGSGAGFLDLEGETVGEQDYDHSIIVVKSGREKWGYEVQLPKIISEDPTLQDEAEAQYREEFSQSIDTDQPNRYVRIKSRTGFYFEGQPSDSSVQQGPSSEAIQNLVRDPGRARAALEAALGVSSLARAVVDRSVGSLLGDERGPEDKLASYCCWGTTPHE